MSLEAVYWKVNKEDYINYSIQLTGSTKREILAAAHQLKGWSLKRSRRNYKESLDMKLMSKSFRSEQKWKEFTKTLSFPLQELVFKPNKP